MARKSKRMDGFTFPSQTGEAKRPYERESRRPPATSLAPGQTARALYEALRDKALATGLTIRAVQEASGVGVSTFQKLRAGRPVRHAIVLKVCAYLGTDVSNVLATPQRKETNA